MNLARFAEQTRRTLRSFPRGMRAPNLFGNPCAESWRSKAAAPQRYHDDGGERRVGWQHWRRRKRRTRRKPKDGRSDSMRTSFPHIPPLSRTAKSLPSACGGGGSRQRYSETRYGPSALPSTQPRLQRMLNCKPSELPQRGLTIGFTKVLLLASDANTNSRE